MSTTAVRETTERIVFLSPSDFSLGDISFEAGLYAVQQLVEGQQRVLVFTRIAGASFQVALYGESDEDDDATWLCCLPISSATTPC